ncbi:MAG: putative glycoside hydrolase [Spirochaetota bacterium]|nr:putative glycoside hydrolase [Spirochaetota bacterium]
MSIRKKNILLSIIILIPVIVLLNIYFIGIGFYYDSITNFLVNVYESVIPKEPNYKIIDPAYCKRYKKTFANLPEGFIHSGHMLFYKAMKRIRIREIAEKAIAYTHFYKIYQLKMAIKEYNSIGRNTIQRDTVLYIPSSLPTFLLDYKKRKKPEIKYVRGLYFTGYSIGSENIVQTIKRLKEVGINAIVFDAKDVVGVVNYYSRVSDVQQYRTHDKRSIDDIDKLIRILRENNIYIIVRISVFRDHLICRRNPNFAIRSRSTGGIWNYGSKELWCDPSNKMVQDYNIALAIELADKGVDEIQFDYIRFPTVGNIRDADFKYHFGRMSNEETIAHFLKRAYNEISPRNTLLSIDIFGVVAWGKKVDIRNTGQKVEILSQYCDILSPMLYPSHFEDHFEGFEKPGDHPYYFIYNGCRKVTALSGGKAVRPWLQAFKWRTTLYNKYYILEEILACRDAGAVGYMFWNSRNNYDTVYQALSHMAYSKLDR